MLNINLHPGKFKTIPFNPKDASGNPTTTLAGVYTVGTDRNDLISGVPVDPYSMKFQATGPLGVTTCTIGGQDFDGVPHTTQFTITVVQGGLDHWDPQDAPETNV